MGSLGEQAVAPHIIDIRSDAAGIELKQEILSGLKPEDGGEKTLPTLLLYDDEGLRLFEEITYLDEYYLTEEEIAILTKYADRIAERIPEGSNVVELGSGNLRKIKILLDALEKAGKQVHYYALDLMYDELVRTLQLVPEGTYKHIRCAGLWGTYDDGLAWLKQPKNAAKPKAILSMGSSIGNFPPSEAVEFLAQFAAELKPQDLMLVALDGCQDPDRVYRAYNDRGDVTHNFTSNGLKHANRLLDYEAFRTDDWEATGEFDSAGSRHRAFVTPKKDVTIEGTLIKKGEKVRIEESYKWPFREAENLWRQVSASAKVGANRSRIIEGTSFANDEGTYYLHLLQRPEMISSSKPEQYAAHPVPSLAEWHELWNTWDNVTRKMIPDEKLYDKPIKLRNACIFYLGHIPTFFDMKLTEATKTPPTEPKYFYKIFERGIDPDVENPEKVHAHSEVPDEWPPLDEILRFQQGVRDRVTKFYKSGQAYDDLWTGRTLWLAFEHEIMHMETLLYMLIQSDKTLPPPGTMKPDFEQLAAQAKRDAVENQWIDVPEQKVTIGLNDPDNGDGPVRYFGWDVETPPYTRNVKAFKSKARPITNGEYAQYLAATEKHQLPASWMEMPKTNGTNGVNGVNGHTNGDAGLHHFLEDKAVRTIYGPVPLKYALDWPIAASYDELNGCAKYMGGRIPTLEEVRSIYLYSDALKKKEAANALPKMIPAVNSHLVNEGVQETPPPHPSINGASSAKAGPNPRELFADLTDANVGFKHWHPMPVTQNGGKLAGLSEMGGLWEWTASELVRVDGFEPMKLYPAYSEDFYDGKHNVVLGGSWATHPRVAGRKTFVNWYQRNYPFVWAGARMVKDA
ncbi:uncharacterized protein LTR77_009299 [Saxophila tyrrhenica]|uniref:Uncharacterized protein n=1 Tax=Saxophila tyrrhenica TaxID=1690608 RepID=A0AAV9NYN3_9PEZI|nr:hypothetical protein LTR77_009299 [Saxophila tyrrhenica]